MSSSAPIPGYAEAAALVAAYAAGLSSFSPAVESVGLDNARGRVLARPVIADLDQPPFDRSTRDGFACRAAEALSRLPLPIAGSTRAGQALPPPLAPGAAWEIMTGAPVPAGADAVVMLEHVEAANGLVRLLSGRSAKPGENIVSRGAHGRAGQQLLPAGAVIGPGQIALAAACGLESLFVFARPRVAILTTGDELAPVGQAPAPGQIRNSNASMLAAMVEAAGGEPVVLPTAPDEAGALDAALAEVQNAKAGLLLITGGVSAGKFDLVEPALARAGAVSHFTGVRIQPGKPLVFGELPRQSGSPSRPSSLPFFGLPGNPVSSAVTFLLFGAPVLAAMAGCHEQGPRFTLARLAPAANRHAKAGITRFLPAFCNFSAPPADLPEAAFVPWHGSGDLTALARCNCFLVIPEDAPGPEPGAIVRILLA